MKAIVFSLAVFCVNSVTAQYDIAKSMYVAANIPEALLPHANVVYREAMMNYEILNKDKARQTDHYIITILNEQGANEAVQAIQYSKLIKLTSISGAVYDATGNQVKKIKSSEISDQSATGSEMFSDVRVKILRLAHSTYPYTIEYETVHEYQFLFHIPEWQVIPSGFTSVQHSSVTLSYPKDIKPRYKTFRVEKAGVVTTKGNNESIRWDFFDQHAIEPEPFGWAVRNTSPLILMAPGDFEYEGYSGNMDSWSNFGKWIAALNEGRDVLPEETVKRVAKLVEGKATLREKVEAVYKDMQSRTRYVSVQVGIGGQQPFEASKVDATGYGDCKALSNYMVSLLKAAGITARYVLINSGEGATEMYRDFPSTQFDHVVVAVPSATDTLWLECTSQTRPAGYAGKFTGDRYALMITEAGGKMVHTPRYPDQVNVQSREATVILTPKGNLEAKVTTHYKGVQYENDGLDDVLHKGPEEQRKWVFEHTKLPGLELGTYKLQNHPDVLPSADLEMEVTSLGYANVSGKRVFVNPNLLNRFSYVPPKLTERKSSVKIWTGFVDEDKVNYSIPENLSPEFIPPAIHITSSFGSYDASFVVEQGKLTYQRKLVMRKGEYPAQAYTELVDFFKSVSKADNTKIVFLSKT